MEPTFAVNYFSSEVWRFEIALHHIASTALNLIVIWVETDLYSRKHKAHRAHTPTFLCIGVCNSYQR